MHDEVDIVPYYKDKVHQYQRNRWRYDSAAITKLLEETGLHAGAVVADIGAGTGISSEPFVRAGCQVYAVEPGESMRRSAEQAFAGRQNYHSIDGRAEASGLPAAFADMIVVGRALHWFAQAEARAEFGRIAKPGGWLAAVRTSSEHQALKAVRSSLERPEIGWNLAASKFHRHREPLNYFFDKAGHQEISTAQVIIETWPQFLGRLLSLAPAPGRDHVLYDRFEAAAREIFDTYQEGERLVIPAMTRIAFGHPAGHSL